MKVQATTSGQDATARRAPMAPFVLGFGALYGVLAIVLASPENAYTPWTLIRPDAHPAWRSEPAALDAAQAQEGLPG